jgi:hypothetical protein
MGKTLIRRCIRLYVRSAAGLAFRLFAPRGGFLPPTEPVFDGFSIVRGTLGVLFLLLVNAAYGTDLGGVTGVPLSPPSLADSWVLAGAPGIITVLAVVALCLTRRGYRRRAVRQLVCPVQTVFIFLVLVFALGRGIPFLAQASGRGLITSLGVDLLSLLATIWCFIFYWCVLWCCTAGPFRAGDGHPLLAPAVTTAFAWFAAVHALVANGPPGTMPHPLYFTVIFGGPTTVMVVSGVEIWLLRNRYPSQFPFREGPLTANPRPAAPWSDVHLIVFVGQQLAGFGQQLKELGQRLARIG